MYHLITEEVKKRKKEKKSCVLLFPECRVQPYDSHLFTTLFIWSGSPVVLLPPLNTAANNAQVTNCCVVFFSVLLLSVRLSCRNRVALFEIYYKHLAETVMQKVPPPDSYNLHCPHPHKRGKSQTF